jgi:predicted secreted protein
MNPHAMIAQMIALLALSTAAFADHCAGLPPTYDRITLAASASQEVANDTLVAVLSAQREGGDPARLAAEVNQAMQAALEAARRVEGVKAQTLDYHTSPVYRQQEVSGWRVTQTLRLEGRDAARLSGLIGDLQRTLALQSVGYTVSRAGRAEIEDALLRAALDAFGRRVRLVAEQLERPGYRIVEVELTTGEPPTPRPFAYQGRAALAASEAAPPTLEAGTQTVTVTVRGTVELQRP